MQVVETNLINAEINREGFDELFDIFAIRRGVTDNKFNYWRTRMLDAPLASKRVLSVWCKPYRDGVPSCVYVLMRKKDDNRIVLRETIKDDPDSDKITIFPVCASELMPCDLIQLCFNGINCNNDPDLSVSNLTGNLYMFSPTHIEINKENNAARQVHALSLRVSKNMMLYMNVVTFTNIDEKIGNIDNRALYQLYKDPVFSMRRVYKKENGAEVFVIKQYKNAKYNIPFLDIADIHSFNACKMGILQKAMTLFKQKFGKFIKLSFTPLEKYDFIDHSSTESRQMEKHVQDYINGKVASFCNQDGGEKGDEIIAKLSECFEAYGAKTHIAKELSKQALNIVIIHDADYYTNANRPDAYRSVSPKEYIVQHVTVEDMKGKRLNVKVKETNGKLKITQPAIAKNIFCQFAIKDDIACKKMRMFDWSSIDENMSFFYSYGEDNEKTAVMDIKKDGSFYIHYNDRQITMFDDIEKTEDSEPKLTVKTGSGKEFVIIETKWYTVPRFSDIHERLINNDTQLKSKEVRDELMSSSLDIKCFKINDTDFAYFVGAIGAGLDSSWLHRAPNIRIVKASEPGLYPYFVKKILPLMNVMFVRTGQLTVMPFPFKYIREWVERENA